MQERGAARYLGVYFSFEGTGGNPWAEEDAYFDRIVGGFFASCATLEPEAKQYRLLVQSNLLSKALFGGGVRWPTEMQMEAARQRCAQGLAKTLDLGSLGGGGGGRCDAESEEDAAAAAADAEFLIPSQPDMRVIPSRQVGDQLGVAALLRCDAARADPKPAQLPRRARPPLLRRLRLRLVLPLPAVLLLAPVPLLAAHRRRRRLALA